MHIGSHKAGSTSIQEYCQTHPAELLAAGIHYPTGAFPRYPDQHSELTDLVERDRAEEIQAFFARVTAAATAEGARVVFLSGEDLCTLGPGLAHRLHELAVRAFDGMTVVLLLRNKRDYLYSSFKHHLLHGQVTAEHDFVARQIFSPRRTVEAWRGVGGVTTQVLSYDAMRGELLPTFFRTVFDIAVESPIRANGSLDYMTLQMLNTLGKRPEAAGVEPGLLQLVLQVLARHPAPGHLPIEDVIADNLDRCYADDDWRVPGIDFADALLRRRQMARASIDLAAEAARMSELYFVLQTYFATSDRAA